MDNGPLTLDGRGPAGKRRGRPPGAKSKRSLDLARYVEAQFGGMTPGEQSARVSMVTAKELKAARGDLVAAMARKATELAALLGCEPVSAWKLMADERTGLMPYVHQRQAQVTEIKGRGIVPVLMVGALDEDPGPPPIEGDWTAQSDDELSFIDVKPGQVSRFKSHAEGETLAPQGLAAPSPDD